MFRSKLTHDLIIIFIVVAAQLNPLVSSNSDEDNEVEIHDPFIPSALKEILTEEAASYKLPAELKKDFVYYHSGFDDENRPVWVVEAGKWDVRKYVEGGLHTQALFDRFLAQCIYRVLNSTQILATEEEPVDEVVLIVDLENFSFWQASHPPTAAFILDRYQKFVSVFEKIDAAYLINTNYIGEATLGFLRPILGNEFEKIIVHGTNKSKWIPQILKNIPRDQLPEWYGGVKDFVPYGIYG